MKKIEAIIKPFKLKSGQRGAGRPRDSGNDRKTEVKGLGRQKGHTEHLTAAASTSWISVPKLKIELVVADPQAALVVDSILKSAKTGKIGDGKIFVSTVESVIRIRTGENR